MTYPIQSRLSKFFDTKLAIILVLLAVVFICSCTPKYTEQAAIEGVNKANDNYPAPVASWLRGKYPCIIKASDTTTLTKDSIVYLQCPDLPLIVHEPGTTDTVYKTNTVKVPFHLPVQVQRITTYIEDSAKIKVMFSHIAELDDTLDKYEKDIKAIANDYMVMKGKRDYWRIRFFILAGAFGLAILLRIKRIL